jgi:hypothetical protein
MKNLVLRPAMILALILVTCAQGYSTAAGAEEKRKGLVEEQIWALEEAYFTNLYRANYEGVLSLVHSQFLGWPGGVPQPMDRDESNLFMKKLIPKPTSCTVKIERAGMRLLGDAALTQYTLVVHCADNAGAVKSQSSRITHTWVKKEARWKLLGGMSRDQ